MLNIKGKAYWNIQDWYEAQLKTSDCASCAAPGHSVWDCDVKPSCYLCGMDGHRSLGVCPFAGRLPFRWASALSHR